MTHTLPPGEAQLDWQDEIKLSAAFDVAEWHRDTIDPYGVTYGETSNGLQVAWWPGIDGLPVFQVNHPYHLIKCGAVSWLDSDRPVFYAYPPVLGEHIQVIAKHLLAGLLVLNLGIDDRFFIAHAGQWVSSSAHERLEWLLGYRARLAALELK